jgi:hypothetical protein
MNQKAAKDKQLEGWHDGMELPLYKYYYKYLHI